MAVAENDPSATVTTPPPPPPPARSYENGDLQQQSDAASNHLENGTTEGTANPKLSKDQTYVFMPPQPAHNFADDITSGTKRHSILSKSAGATGYQYGSDDANGNHVHSNKDVVGYLRNGENGEEAFNKDIRDLEEMLSKLNPMAEAFVPNFLAKSRPLQGDSNYSYANGFVVQQPNSGNGMVFPTGKKKSSYGQGKRRMSSRATMAQREEVIRRTVYVSDIDQQVTEENLALMFSSCGQVVDCRICGDPNSVLRFAFIEFTNEEGARNALVLSSTMLGFYPLRVLPSKTAIAPVNPTLLPRSSDEREMCARTVYCTNIDKKISQTDVKLFFESLCGKVQRLRLLGDYNHSTLIAFVEFVLAESAIAALSCSGAFLGSLPIRVGPSKTPVRPRAVRQLMH